MGGIKSLQIKRIYSCAATRVRIREALIVWVQLRGRYFSKVLINMSSHLACQHKYDMPLLFLDLEKRIWQWHNVITNNDSLLGKNVSIWCFSPLTSNSKNFHRLKTKHPAKKIIIKFKRNNFKKLIKLII